MFLCLKILVFGLVLVDVGVFGKDQSEKGSPPTPSPDEIFPPSNSSLTIHMDSNSSSIQPLNSTAAQSPLTHSTTTHAPTAGDPDNSSMYAGISISTDTPTKIYQVPADTTSSPIASTTSRDCSGISISVTDYKYMNRKSRAKVNIMGATDLQDVSCTSLSQSKHHDECHWNNSSQSLTGLDECNMYEVQAWFNGCNKTTEITVPPVGRDLKEHDKNDTSVTLVWKLEGLQCYGFKYSYCCYLQAEKSSDNCREKSKENSKTLLNLSPNKNYTCTSKIFWKEKEVHQKSIQITTDIEKPCKPENVTIQHNATAISISWKKPKKTDNSRIDGYQIIIKNQSAIVYKTMLSSCENCYVDVPNMEPYTVYEVSVSAYAKRPNKSEIGGEKYMETIHTEAAKPTQVRHINGSLSSEANNYVIIRCAEPAHLYGPSKSFTLEYDDVKWTEDKCFFNVKDLYHLKRYNFTVIFNNGIFDSEPSWTIVDTKYNAKALIGFLIFLIIVTVVALLGVLYKIYTINREKSRNTDEVVQLVPRDDERQLMSIEPIPTELFCEAYKRKIADEGRLFLEEFQSIPRFFSKFSTKDARKSYNQNKNRYIDILPYDYNRVVLSGIPNDLGSDYTNASHIDGFKEPRKYIAAQGPKDETTDDFWRMIWEQKATIVVMVTRCEEGNKIKCAKYWPTMKEGSACYGDIVVKINECKIYPDYNIQKLHITHRREKTTGRDVTHIQFTSWPDHGVPDDPHLLLKLRRRVNALSNFFSGPIVVHCSAGVGRTGTYIGIDAMLEGLETEGRVDVYGYVVKLRRQRCLMVQVEAQYILIHQALVEYIQYGETELNISELHGYLSHLKKRDPPSDPSLLEAEFQRLPSYKTWQKTGKREENRSKNRSSTVIPYDYNRVLFKHEEEVSKENEHDGEESSDEDSDCDEEPNKYINASFIHGYWLQNAMIATQGPLLETITDFWNMVYQRKVKVIVMLTELKDDSQELCAQYWEDGKMSYDGITVELKDVKNCSCYTVRTFDISHVKRKEPRKVFQYQYHKWKAFALPENPKDLVAMIWDLKKNLSPGDETPETYVHGKNVQVVIHCRDGSQQTGVFCALLNLLESAETEAVIDVFQVVKSLRRARPGMVSSFEDYEFLYDAIASVYPAQNGQGPKTPNQEYRVDVPTDVTKEEETNSVATSLCLSVGMEMSEHFRPQDGSREAESSSNGPMNPVLTP